MSPESTEARLAALRQQVDDLAEDVRAFAGATAQQAVFNEQIGNLREKLAEIRRDLDALHQSFREFQEQLANREKLQVRERKADRRWLIGTVVASTAVIIAALGLVANVIGG